MLVKATKSMYYVSDSMEKKDKRFLSTECLQQIGQQVRLVGWVQTVRSHGKIAFFDLRDRMGVIQIVSAQSAVVDSIVSLSQQDVVEVTGTVKKRDKRYVNSSNPTGTIEVEAGSVTVIAKAETLPFDMGGKDLHLELPTLLDYRSLTLRHQTIQSIFKIQEAVLEGFRRAVKDLGCVEIVVSTIAASATEGGAEVFRVDYYDFKAYLTQSPQLYKQMMIPVFERVWTIAHAYRAEPSVTTRHLSETTQMDCEFGFVNFEDLLDLLEGIAISMLSFAEKQNLQTLKERGIEKIAFGKVPRLKLKEAQEIIFKEFGRDIRNEKDLGPQDEIDICAWVKKVHSSDLVTITHFPTKKRAFYTMPDPENQEVSLSYDLLFRGIEILSGSQRIHNYHQLIEAIKSRGMDPKNFTMYLMAFRYGMPPEGGFSFGLERITMKMLNLGNVREASLFPRDMERVDERFSVMDKTS